MMRSAACFLVLVLALPVVADEAAKPRIRIAIVGDSTAASYAKPPKDRPDLTGWGQVFGEVFRSGQVEILNHAASGRSSKSFLAEGRWEPVLKERPDYVFIQFGHNDQPSKGERATDPATTFPDNLRRYVREAKAAGIQPVLVTPVARRTFQGEKTVSTLGPYADATLKVGQETATPVIDLHEASRSYYEKLGDAGSRDLSPSDSDRTHFSRKGALAIAHLVVGQLAEHVPALAAYLEK